MHQFVFFKDLAVKHLPAHHWAKAAEMTEEPEGQCLGPGVQQCL